jgi:hypothetical protein
VLLKGLVKLLVGFTLHVPFGFQKLSMILLQAMFLFLKYQLTVIITFAVYAQNPKMLLLVYVFLVRSKEVKGIFT